MIEFRLDQALKTNSTMQVDLRGVSVFQQYFATPSEAVVNRLHLAATAGY